MIWIGPWHYYPAAFQPPTNRESFLNLYRPEVVVLTDEEFQPPTNRESFLNKGLASPFGWLRKFQPPTNRESFLNAVEGADDKDMQKCFNPLLIGSHS